MEDASLFATVALPIAVATIMFSLGLTLKVDDFRRVARQPRGVAIGLTNLLLISPFLAFAVATLFDLDPAFAVGLVLLGASPGGTMANLLTRWAGGEVALSVTMTAVSSVAALITVPLFLGLAVDHFDARVADDVNMAGVVVRVFLITIVPLALGMWMRARRPVRVAEIEPRVKRVTFAVFVLVVAGAVASEFDTITDHFAELAAATLALNVAAMSVSFGVARLARLNDRQSTAIAMELGVHNSSLAIAVGTSVAAVLGIPAAVYSAFMFFTAGFFARVMYKRNSAAEPEPEPAPALA